MNKSLKIAVIALTLMSSGTYAEPATFQANVTVQNAFSFTKDNDLNFGTIRAKADTTTNNTASLVLPANPATAPSASGTAPAEISILVAGTPASFSVSGVSPFATLAITNPTETNIIAGTAPPGTAGFTLSAPTYYVLTGATPNSAATTTIQADSNGEATFNVGATLTTSALTPSADYIDGTYSGTFTLQLDYQ